MIKLPENDMSAMIENDALENVKAETTEERLSILSGYVEELQSLDWDIELISEELKEKEKKKTDLLKKTIPDFFDELGLNKLEAADGTVIEIKQFYAPSIKAANVTKAYKWLTDNGHGSLIKHVVQAFLDVSDTKTRDELIENLEKMGYTFEEKKSIHAATLKSFVNEQKEKGVEFPEGTIDCFEVKEAKIKKPKIKKPKGKK